MNEDEWRQMLEENPDTLIAACVRFADAVRLLGQAVVEAWGLARWLGVGGIESPGGTAARPAAEPRAQEGEFPTKSAGEE